MQITRNSLDTVGEDENSDLYVDAHGQLDFKASYEVRSGTSVFLQVQNITDEPLNTLPLSKTRPPKEALDKIMRDLM